MIIDDCCRALIRPTADDTRGNLGPAAVQAISARWQRYWVRRTQYATIRLLQSLDDRMLKDIGIARDAIPRAVLGRGR